MIGAFGSNLLEPMPPILVFNTKSNTRPKASWVADLSEVVGHWGFISPIVVDYQVAVRQKGSMESLYPNLAPCFE